MFSLNCQNLHSTLIGQVCPTLKKPDRDRSRRQPLRSTNPVDVLFPGPGPPQAFPQAGRRPKPCLSNLPHPLRPVRPQPRWHPQSRWHLDGCSGEGCGSLTATLSCIVQKVAEGSDSSFAKTGLGSLNQVFCRVAQTTYLGLKTGLGDNY